MSRRPVRALTQSTPGLIVLLLAASALARHGTGSWIPIPTIYHDEWLYMEMARSLGEGRLFAWGSFQTHFPCWLYPGMLAWPVAAFDYDHAIRAIRWMNAVCMSLTILPAYGLAREATGRVRALAATLLVALLPSLIFSGMVMTENAYVPLFMLAMWLIYRAIERPTAANRFVGGLVAALPLHAKPQGLIVPLIAIATVAIFEIGRLSPARGGSVQSRVSDYVRSVSAHWLTAAGFVIGYLPRVMEIVFFEHPHEAFQLKHLMGFYYNMGFKGAGFSARLFLPALAANFIGWIVACGVLPAFALGRVLVTRELWIVNRPRVRLLAIQAAVASAGQIFLNARHITLSNEPPVIYERYFMAMLPMALIVFTATAGRLPRTRAGIRTGLGLTAAIIAMFALTQYPIRWNLSSATPSLSGIMLLYTEPWSKSQSWIPLLWLAAGATAVIMLFRAHGRLGRSVAAIALLFAFMNFGAYAFEGKSIAPAIRDMQRFARQVAKAIGPEGRLVIWGDGLRNDQMFQLGFRNRGRLVFVQPGRDNHWMADRLKIDAAGRIESPFPIGKSWLAAAESKKFNMPPLLRMKGAKDREGISIYKMESLRAMTVQERP
ncbi:glycosyltransferase family 39 protein [bacterium]|nr:glycosyltransferase family 39 protein [bacterium]